MIIYNSSECVKYLIIIYVNDYRHHFIKCYINKVLHFETTTTSRNESGHAVLKRQIGFSSEDLKTMIDEIVLLLINELHNYIIVFEEIKSRYLLDFRKKVFNQLTAHVTPYAIRRILIQYDILTERATVLNSCTKI